jgi:DNA-binding NarL/FixJ family response regulator
VDDQALFRESLGRLLATQPGLQVVAECGDTGNALRVLSSAPVDVVLLDFDFGMERGGGFMAAARRKGYQGRFLLLAAAADAGKSARAIKLGAAGIFLKSEAADRLVRAITLVSNGAVWLDQRIIRVLADRTELISQMDDPGHGNALTGREQKVLLGILGGLTNRRIGENLGLTESSVKALVRQLFHRTGVRTRSQLVRAALEGSLGTASVLMRPTQNAASAEDGLKSDEERTSLPVKPLTDN